jgi:hypothetical protein
VLQRLFAFGCCCGSFYVLTRSGFLFRRRHNLWCHSRFGVCLIVPPQCLEPIQHLSRGFAQRLGFWFLDFCRVFPAMVHQLLQQALNVSGVVTRILFSVLVDAHYFFLSLTLLKPQPADAGWTPL